MRTKVDTLLIGLNLIVGAVLLGLLFAPGGMVTSRVRNWAMRRQHAEFATTHWRTLVDGAARLDQGRGRVQLVVFSDYECPYCRSLDQTLATVMAADSTIGVALRHYPLAIHPSAETGARAAWCAMRQGRFGPMHHELFFSTRWLSDTSWSDIATSLQVPDPESFTACIRSTPSEAAIQSDVALGDSLGVKVTPTLVLEGKLVEGTLTAEQLSSLLHGKDRG